MVLFIVDLLLHFLVGWVDEVGCKLSQRLPPLSIVWNSPLALHVDELVGVDLQTRQLQLLLVTSNAKANKGVQLLLLQERAEFLGPASNSFTEETTVVQPVQKLQKFRTSIASTSELLHLVQKLQKLRKYRNVRTTETSETTNTET